MPAPLTTVERAREALLEQWTALGAWIGELAQPQLAQPSVVEGWSVADLVAHLGVAAGSVTAAVDGPPGKHPLTLSEYVATYREGASAIDARTRDAARSGGGSVQQTVDSAFSRAEAALALAPAGDPVVTARRGPIRLSDFLVTRCIELVVHGDDLGRSTGDDTVPLTRAARQLSVRALAGVLAERAPGRSVEVRIPPFAAVQCIDGPRHTRGTPPAVVETDPVTFLRLATGRLGWAEAATAGRLRLSGLRTDLSPYLPLLA